MGKRRHSRVRSILPVKVTGRADDKPFTQVVHTLDISQAGTRLGGFRVPVKVGDVVTLLYKHWRGNFQIMWLGQKGTAAEGEAGLQACSPGDCFWSEIANEIMTQYVDDYYRPPEPTAPAKAAASPAPQQAPQPATAADALSTRVPSLTARLVEIEHELRSSEVDPAAMQEFHEILDKLRSTCLAVQELIRTRLRRIRIWRKSPLPEKMISQLSRQAILLLVDFWECRRANWRKSLSLPVRFTNHRMPRK